MGAGKSVPQGESLPLEILDFASAAESEAVAGMEGDLKSLRKGL